MAYMVFTKAKPAKLYVKYMQFAGIRHFDSLCYTVD
jgi:hypothetical protein